MSFAGRPLTDPFKRVGVAVLDVILFVVTLGIGWLVWLLVLLPQAQTPGMQLIGLEVIDLDSGARAGAGTMALRELIGKGAVLAMAIAVTLLTVFFGWVPWLVAGCSMFFTANNQALWDIPFGTSVVDLERGGLVGEPPGATRAAQSRTVRKVQ